MKHIFSKTAWIAAGILALAALTRADEMLFVSPGGIDAWSGTLPEANAAHSDGPLATLDKARLAVRARIARGLTSPITVRIRSGKYELDKTVVFGPADSGTEKCPITYQAYPGEKPVFTGSKRLTNWKPCTQYPEGLPDAAKGTLWYCDIPADLKGSWRITTLYDGLTLLPRAHSKDLQVAPTRIKDDNNAQPKNLDGKIKPNDAPLTFTRTFLYQNSDLRESPDVGDIDIFIRPKHSWLINLLPLAKVDAATKTATFTVAPTYQVKPNNVYHVDNAIEYLDQEGKWYFSSKEGRVYNPRNRRRQRLQENIRRNSQAGKRNTRHRI